jgi:hypothetical protein
LNVPVWNKESEDDEFAKYNKEWEEKIQEIEQNHFLELNTLREKLAKRLAEGSTDGADQLGKAYEELMAKYNELSGTQRGAENDKRNLISSYEAKLKDATKEVNALKKESEVAERKSEAEKKKLVDGYEKKLASTASNQEKELRREMEQLRVSG